MYSDADQRKHQSSASLAFARGIHRWPVNSPHKGPVTRKMFPFDDVIMHFTPVFSTAGGVGRNSGRRVWHGWVYRHRRPEQCGHWQHTCVQLRRWVRRHGGWGNVGSHHGVGVLKGHTMGWGYWRVTPWGGVTEGSHHEVGVIEGSHHSYGMSGVLKGHTMGLGLLKGHTMGWGYWRVTPWGGGTEGSHHAWGGAKERPHHGVRVMKSHTMRLGLLKGHTMWWGCWRVTPWGGGTEGSHHGVGALNGHIMGWGHWMVTSWGGILKGRIMGLGLLKGHIMGWAGYWRVTPRGLVC